MIWSTCKTRVFIGQKGSSLQEMLIEEYSSVRKPAFQCFDSIKSTGKCLTSLESHAYILKNYPAHYTHQTSRYICILCTHNDGRNFEQWWTTSSSECRSLILQNQSIPRPLVSTGKNMQATAARHNITSNTMSASIWWQLRSIATATRGQTTPPILPTAVAIPAPVERTTVGYTYEKKEGN